MIADNSGLPTRSLPYCRAHWGHFPLGIPDWAVRGGPLEQLSAEAVVHEWVDYESDGPADGSPNCADTLLATDSIPKDQFPNHLCARTAFWSTYRVAYALATAGFYASFT